MERDHNRTCGTSPASYNQIILVPEGTGRHFMLAERHHSRARWFNGFGLSAVKSINENAEMASNLTRNFFTKIHWCFLVSTSFSSPYWLLFGCLIFFLNIWTVL